MILSIKDTNFLGFISQSYLKVSLEPIRTQNLESLLEKLSQTTFNLQSPDSDMVCSYLIGTVYKNEKTEKDLTLSYIYDLKIENEIIKGF